MFWLLLITALIILTYVLILRRLSYWKGKGVSQKSIFTIIKNYLDSILQNKPFVEILVSYYYEFPKKRDKVQEVDIIQNCYKNCFRYSAVYSLGTSALLIKDIELIKQLTVKDFDHFTDHRTFVPEHIDTLWANNLFSLKGEKWRQMRATLSPSFTSSKMKGMFLLMNECAEDFTKNFLRDNTDIVHVHLDDVISRYANDVIATTAFGIKCDSLKDRDNEFYLMGKDASSIFKGKWATIKFTLFTFLPSVASFFNIKLFSKKVSNFFLNLIKTNIKMRKEKNIVRLDMIHLLMEACKNGIKDDQVNLPDTGFATVEEHVQSNGYKKNMELSDVDITAQALIFFLAGFDTVSRAICFTLYELAIHPDVQSRLREEVDDTLVACNGKITYEAITKMKYLDMVITEGLRLWPNAVLFDRVCVKPYTIEPVLPDENPVHLNVGDVIWISSFTIHRDPHNYPDPERFDPERFNDDNKNNITPYSYIPFGVGPRNCIGSRYALLETKILFFNLISKFDIVPTEKTQIPLKVNRKELVLSAENGIHLGFKQRFVN